MPLNKETHKGWYAIKQRNQTKEVEQGSKTQDEDLEANFK